MRKEKHLTPLKTFSLSTRKRKHVNSHFRSLDGAGLLPNNFDVVDRVMQELKNSTNFVKSVDSWHEKFTDFVNQEFLHNQPLKLPNAEMSKSFFQQKLTQFLFTKGKRKSELFGVICTELPRTDLMYLIYAIVVHFFQMVQNSAKTFSLLES